jgi:hypothetical protein
VEPGEAQQQDRRAGLDRDQGPAQQQGVRAFFFDLDVGDRADKYPSQGDAVTDLRRFCEATKLPRPMVVTQAAASTSTGC